MQTLEKPLKMTLTQRRHLAHFADLSTVEITENEIRGIKKAFNRLGLDECTRENDFTPKLRVYCDSIATVLDTREAAGRRLRITAKQGAKGLKWLKNLQWTPSGQVRKHAPLSDWQERVLASFTHFEFEGMDEGSNGYRTFYEPIYRVCGTAGHFSYVAKSWQSGGVPFYSL